MLRSRGRGGALLPNQRVAEATRTGTGASIPRQVAPRTTGTAPAGAPIAPYQAASRLRAAPLHGTPTHPTADPRSLCHRAQRSVGGHPPPGLPDTARHSPPANTGTGNQRRPSRLSSTCHGRGLRSVHVAHGPLRLRHRALSAGHLGGVVTGSGGPFPPRSEQLQHGVAPPLGLRLWVAGAVQPPHRPLDPPAIASHDVRAGDLGSRLRTQSP